MGQFEEVDFKMNETIWKHALLVKVVIIAKAAESPQLVWISLCFAREKHCRDRF